VFRAGIHASPVWSSIGCSLCTVKRGSILSHSKLLSDVLVRRVVGALRGEEMTRLAGAVVSLAAVFT
jgi:hypothetical protein